MGNELILVNQIVLFVNGIVILKYVIEKKEIVYMGVKMDGKEINVKENKMIVHLLIVKEVKCFIKGKLKVLKINVNINYH